ncbi:helix-turn-helix domain-containing protein [Aquimarina litoralis]|uniref:helix-turn-helix domain-containing protein n=1 Tax=Aquimarina litoralis TaxID=584605 RepID=UPI001C56CC29|nr:AraC family transcriptional regulator [Aquimarina litoralis]MBW1293874.1 helix-turn-helix domain-containing protein [Aquimarina litoralis]
MLASSTLTIISGIGVIQSTLFSLLIALKKRQQQSDWILITWFLIFAIHLLLGIGHKIYPITFIDVFIMTISFLHGPFFFLYTKAITNGKIITIDFLHFLPFTVFFTFSLFVEDIHDVSWELLILFPKLASLIFYPIYILYHYHKRLRFFKSTIADDRILASFWIKTIAILFLISVGVSIIRLITELMVGVSYFEFLDVLRYVILVTVIGFYGLKYGTVYKPEIYIQTAEEKKYKYSPLKKDKISIAISHINQYFQENEEYLQSDFSLAVLSKALQIPKHHLSQIINSDMNTTFYDLVNSKRINRAISRIKEGDKLNLTLEGLGYECGFNSKSAFFHHFKKHTGKTPGQFKKEIGSN